MSNMGSDERKNPRHSGCGLVELTENSTQQEGQPQSNVQENTEANAQIFDLNQKTMQTFGSLVVVCADFEKAGEDVNKEDASHDKCFEGLQAAIGELNDAQHEEIALEQLCNRRDRYDKDFLEMQWSMLKVKGSRDRYDED